MPRAVYLWHKKTGKFRRLWRCVSSHFSFPLLDTKICTGDCGVLYLLLTLNRDRKQSVNPQSLDIGLGEVLVELPQVEDGQHDTEQVDQDPDGIEDIVSVGALAVRSLHQSE